MDILIKGGELFDGDGFRHCDLLVSDGKVSAVSEDIPVSQGCDVIDASGKTVIPGLVDMHVHFREPGYEYKETIAGGVRAAAAGGFTTVCTMPNLNPAPDSMEHLKVQLDAISAQKELTILPYATITQQRRGENILADYEALAPLVAGFSDDGSGVQSAEVMERAMRGIAPTGKILAAHCEVNSLLRGGYIHDGEYARAHGHRGICSESEWREIERDIELARITGVRLHICHISTAESVELVRRAKKEGLPVTCETAAHYLTFTDSDLHESGNWKMNPPIRSASDRMALLEGIADGTIDVIATDHAPHTAAEKSRGLEKSAMGVVGLEISFPAAYSALVRSGVTDFAGLVRLMAINPRRILKCGGFENGAITEGSPAMLTIVDTKAEITVGQEIFKGSGNATPFEGMTLQGKVCGRIYQI